MNPSPRLPVVLRRTRAVALGVALLVALAAVPRPAASDQAAVTVGGPFTLVAPDGSTVTDRSFPGKWLLVFFGYTFCPDTCPTTLGAISVALDDLGAEADRIQPIFITVDPERDTLAAMGNYMKAFDPRILGLSGTPEQIAAVEEGYGAYAILRKSGDDPYYLVDHSTYIYLMDPEGAFVQGYDADTPGPELAQDLAAIIAQGS
jgi:protein SCO1